MTVDVVLDARGLLCPMPIVRMSQKMKTMVPGQILEIQADDRGADMDIPAWCKKTGNEFLQAEENGGFKSYFVKKN